MRLEYVYGDNMIKNDNSVNIKSDERSYHHGGLREAAVNEGMRLLEVASVEDLSLRAIARNVGVSATALYRHFPDKQALLQALAQEGLDKLGVEQRSAIDAAGGGVDSFAAAGRTYVRFALAHPALFRLVMSCQFEGVQSADETNAMALLRNCVADVYGGSSETEQRIAVLRAWGMVHGLAMLMLDGHLPPDDAIIEGVIHPTYVRGIG
jgi:AcrR family transcriptional regulator